MNKKLLLTFGLMGLLAITLVSAAILSYYGMLEETVSVTQPITVNGVEGYYSNEGNIPCEARQTCDGTLLSIENHGNNNVPIEVTTSDNEDVTTLFFAETTLTKKVVEFGIEPWIAVDPADELKLRYAAVGDSFSVEVVNPIEGYELIYYKDSSERFATPGQAIRVSDVTGMLPYADDANAGENDYCGEYLTCHGAKLWFVPSTAILAGEELDWSMASEFYFETELIQFNNVGEFIMYPGQTLDLTPSYQVNALAGTDDIIVNISIIPSTA